MVDVATLFDSHFKIIKAVWIAIYVFAFAFVISALAVVGDSESKAYNFAAIWLALLVIAFGIGGTMVLYRFRTALSVGFLIGASFMFSMQCLSLAVLSGGNVSNPLEDKPSSEKAVVAFAVFLFLLYGAFSILLAVWRDDVINDSQSLAQQDSQQPFDGSAPPVAASGPPGDQI